MNVKTRRLDPRRIPPVQRWYLRARLQPEDKTPTVFVAIAVVAFFVLLLSN